MVNSEELQKAFERLSPWTTRFCIGGQTLGGGFQVGEDEPLMRDFLGRFRFPERVLELGCMEGGRTFPLARRAGHVVAVDVRRAHLQRARFVGAQLGVSNVTFLELDLETCDLEMLGEFDAVYNVGLLYHLADPVRLLGQLASVSPRMFLFTHVAADDAESLCEHSGYQGQLCRENQADLVGGIRGWSFRPTRASLLQMLDEAGYRAVEVVRDEEQTVSLWCRTSASVPVCRPVHRAVPSVAVIVTCHNYGRYLDECLQSVIRQTRRPDEVVVVDDASEDETAEVAGRWADRGVNYLRVEHHDPRMTRLAGLKTTESEYVCFLDADDQLSPNYLRSGLSGFDRYDVGIVYSDCDFFGEWNHTHCEPDQTDMRGMCRLNYIHNGSLVRREALEMSRALEVSVDSRGTHEDWLAWRRILEQGWKARRQPGIYCYRRHDHNRTTSKYESGNYFDLRAMETETITLFIPLSGRTALWPRMREFLDTQTWPHHQTRLFLLDTSQDDSFAEDVRSWLMGCDYRDVRYSAEAVGQAGLADAERTNGEAIDAVRMAAARIYNRLACEVTGNFVWIVEDDVIPPAGAAALLLRAFDEHTASVAGPYRSRYHEGYTAWAKVGQPIHKHVICQPGEGVQVVEGNGFGCVMLRAAVLKETLFTCRQPPHFDFDPMFYARLNESGLKAKLNWDCPCEHLEGAK